MFADAKFQDRSEAYIKFRNCYDEKIKWTLSSLSHCFMTVPNTSRTAHTPVKSGADYELDENNDPRMFLFRVRYPVFRVEKTSGFLDAGQCAVVRAEFWPIEIGKYSHHWELILHSRARTDAFQRVHRLCLK